LLESSYEECILYELKKRGLKVEKQKSLPLVYENVHLAQVLTYLKLSDCRLGLLINFNEALIKNGIRRVINNL
jgi:hypothetical protein